MARFKVHPGVPIYQTGNYQPRIQSGKYVFDPLDWPEAEHDVFKAEAAARLQRDQEFFRLRKMNIYVIRSRLRNQLREYAGYGIPDGRTRDVYYLTVGEWYDNPSKRETRPQADEGSHQADRSEGHRPPAQTPSEA